jgi:hypothetical protein
MDLSVSVIKNAFQRFDRCTIYSAGTDALQLNISTLVALGLQCSEVKRKISKEYLFALDATGTNE